jgi:hypothetical protein
MKLKEALISSELFSTTHLRGDKITMMMMMMMMMMML